MSFKNYSNCVLKAWSVSVILLGATCTNNNRGVLFALNFGSTTTSRITRFQRFLSSSLSKPGRIYEPSKALTRTTTTTSLMSTKESISRRSLSVPDFVRDVKQRVVADGYNNELQQQQYLLPHLVLGNQAGDADSIISAITLAYVESLRTTEEENKRHQQFTVPIVSIPADYLKFLRPETVFLLKDCAGMNNLQNDVNDLIAIDQIELLPKKATLTLVDHNNHQYQHDNNQWTVTGIVDHHLDEGKHIDTCPPPSQSISSSSSKQKQKRIIAFNNSEALVASTTTLIVEQFYNDNASSTKMHPTLAVLLLGVILLDSVNMNEQARKGTPRDLIAIQQLLDDTDWTQIKLPDVILSDHNGDGDNHNGNRNGNDGRAYRPDSTKFFNHLESLKFSSEFWNGLTPEQAIRMDYKSYSISSSSSPLITIGLSSILLDITTFFENDNHNDTLLTTIAKVIHEDQLKLFGMMFCTSDDNNDDNKKFRRELAFASTNKVTLDRLVKYLIQDNTTTPNLQIEVLNVEEEVIEIKKKIDDHDDNDDDSSATTTTLYVVRMKQGNVAGSRKQVAPILLEFFQNESSNI